MAIMLLVVILIQYCPNIEVYAASYVWNETTDGEDNGGVTTLQSVSVAFGNLHGGEEYIYAYVTKTGETYTFNQVEKNYKTPVYVNNGDKVVTTDDWNNITQDNFTDYSEGTKRKNPVDTKGYNIYIDVLDNITNKKGYTLEYADTFSRNQDTKEGHVEDAIKDFANVSRPEDAISIYRYSLYDDRTGAGSNAEAFVACDFNKKDRLFYYYIVTKKGNEANDDEFNTAVFSTPDFIMPEVKKSKVSGKWLDNSSWSGTSYEEIQEQLAEAIEFILIDDDGTFSFSKYMSVSYEKGELDGNMKNEMLNRARALNSLIEVEATDTDINVWLMPDYFITDSVPAGAAPVKIKKANSTTDFDDYAIEITDIKLDLTSVSFDAETAMLSIDYPSDPDSATAKIEMLLTDAVESLINTSFKVGNGAGDFSALGYFYQYINDTGMEFYGDNTGKKDDTNVEALSNTPSKATNLYKSKNGKAEDAKRLTAAESAVMEPSLIYVFLYRYLEQMAGIAAASHIDSIFGTSPEMTEEYVYNCIDSNGKVNAYNLIYALISTDINILTSDTPEYHDKYMVKDDDKLYYIYTRGSMPVAIGEDAGTKFGDFTKYTGLNKDESGKQNVYYAIDFTTLFNKLTEFQKYTIYTSYKSKMARLGQTSMISRVFNATLDVEYSSKVEGNEDLYVPEIMDPIEFDSIKEEVTKFNSEDNMNTGTATLIASYADVAAKYIMAKGLYCSPIKDSTYEIDVQANLYGIHSDLLEVLTSSQFMYEGLYNQETGEEVGQKNYWPHLPTSMSIFSDSGNAISSSADDGFVYFEKNISEETVNQLMYLLFNVEYAFDIFNKSVLGKDELDVDVEALEAWFKSAEAGNLANYFSKASGLSSYDAAVSLSESDFGKAENTGTILAMCRSIIALYNMVEFLGISPVTWSDSINAYYNLYKDNQAFFDWLAGYNIVFNTLAVGKPSTKEPMNKFFTVNGSSVSDSWAKGFAVSALFSPMETNLYDASSIEYIKDSEWISDFYYRYAFYRKALYINTDNSAIINEFVTGQKSGKRVAKLSDLLNYDRDIILYIDDNFYNANKISTVIDSLDYTAIRSNVEQSYDASLGGMAASFAGGLVDLDASSVLKTGGNTLYSPTLASSTTKLGQEPDITSELFDTFLLSDAEILGDIQNNVLSVFDDYEYSVKQPFAVVSAIYKNADLYNETLKALISDNAIFKSSKAICNVPGSKEEDWLSLYNYYMLANLEEQMKSDAASTLDLDAPIFCDVFGNIITESGLVIIPAAANATLCGSSWNPYCVGFAEYYNNGNRIPIEELNDEVYTWLLGLDYTMYMSKSAEEKSSIDLSNIKKYRGGGYFSIDSTDTLSLRTSLLSSGGISAWISWDAINKNSSNVKALFFNDAYYSKASDRYNLRTVNLIVEVLRGAPIENIDYTYEGLDGNISVSKYGIYSAYKLEEIVNMLISGTNGNGTSGNTVVTMPNLAFIEGIEVIVLYAYKLAFAGGLLMLVISLFIDAVRNKIGIMSLANFIVTVMLVVMAITVVPTVISWSYYEANKSLLADEVSDILMLNYVKEYDGAEIGITEVRTPETETELYLKVGDIELQWWDVVEDVLFNNTVKTVSELYELQLEENAIVKQEGVITKADGLYINVQDIMDSTDLTYSAGMGMLSNSVYTRQNGSGNKTGVTSFTIPYYVILDYLVANINHYNIENNITTYSWNIGSNGNILTYDVISPYLKSEEFLKEGYDILGLTHIVDAGVQYPSNVSVFTQEDVHRMRYSMWYPTGAMPKGVVRERVDKLNEFARDYVLENINILGKVPDEVFLKVMALQISIEYNKLFDVGYGESIEIMNIDTRDLMRFLIADSPTVYKYYSYSFSRFVYEEAGMPGVIFAGIFVIVIWLTSFIKPLFMLVILALLIINAIGRKLILKQENKCIEGYTIGCACLALCNYAYAGMLKVSMSLVNLDYGTVAAIILAIVVQVAYVIVLIWIMSIEIKDWKNNGFNEFAAKGAVIVAGASTLSRTIREKIASKTNPAYGEAAQYRRRDSDDYNLSTVDEMMDRDAEREENSNDNIN